MRELVIPEGLKCGFVVMVWSEDDAEEFMEALDAAGFRWAGGMKLTERSNYDKNRDGSIAYYVTTNGERRVRYGAFGKGDIFNNNGYDPFEYDDIMQVSDTKEDEAVFAAAFANALKI